MRNSGNDESTKLRRVFLTLSLALIAVSLAFGAGQPSEEIPRLAKVLGWKAGVVIADVGAGEGQYAFAAHAYVGSNGKVYATELDQKKLAAVKAEAEHRGWKNFEVLEAAEKQTNLPIACCDAILLRRVYHHLTAPMEMDASLYKSLKPSGVLVVIEFPPRASLTLSDPVKGVPANRGGHGIPQKVLIEELTAAGFVVDKIYNNWPDEDYCVLFRKAPSSTH